MEDTIPPMYTQNSGGPMMDVIHAAVNEFMMDSEGASKRLFDYLETFRKARADDALNLEKSIVQAKLDLSTERARREQAERTTVLLRNELELAKSRARMAEKKASEDQFDFAHAAASSVVAHYRGARDDAMKEIKALTEKLEAAVKERDAALSIIKACGGELLDMQKVASVLCKTETDRRELASKLETVTKERDTARAALAECSERVSAGLRLTEEAKKAFGQARGLYGSLV